MKIKQLHRTHEKYNLAQLERHRDLFKGDENFRTHVDRYLTKNEQEPAPVYKRRLEIGVDEYINYSGPIGNYFASWLFTSALTFTSDPEVADPFYDDFKERCTSDGTDYEHFLRDRFIDACIDGRAFWRVEFPAPPEDGEPATRAEWERNGQGHAVLVAIPAKSVINWKKDAEGNYLWLIEYTKTCDLLEPDDAEETVVETWTIWRKDGAHARYELRYAKSKKPNDEDAAAQVPMPKDQGAIIGIPIVEMAFPDELWLMSLIASPQLANFRKRAALSWSIDRTCYAMPVFNVKDRKKPARMGAGYYLQMGLDDKYGYMAPPGAPYGVVKEFVSELKDEIHRVAQQMARGVDNNAAAVGRSGLSKNADDMATEIVLGGYGTRCRTATEKTWTMISEGRGDAVTWTVGGMSSYHVTDADSFSKMALATQGMNIPSVTHHRLVYKRQSQLMLPDANEQDRQQINKEIDDGVTPESLQAMQNPGGFNDEEPEDEKKTAEKPQGA